MWRMKANVSIWMESVNLTQVLIESQFCSQFLLIIHVKKMMPGWWNGYKIRWGEKKNIFLSNSLPIPDFYLRKAWLRNAYPWLVLHQSAKDSLLVRALNCNLDQFLTRLQSQWQYLNCMGILELWALKFLMQISIFVWLSSYQPTLYVVPEALLCMYYVLSF